MKIKFLSVLFVMAVFASCDPNDTNDTPEGLEGSYAGTFKRGDTTTNVNLEIGDLVFTGDSEVEKFPGICNGSYTVAGDSISFQNGCVWTAEFDWSLILNEKWGYTINGNTLTLTKANGDIYTLTKE